MENWELWVDSSAFEDYSLNGILISYSTSYEIHNLQKQTYMLGI